MQQETGIIILAAGGSSRLGVPKQSLPFRGISLLRHAVAVALESGAAAVTVVLGAHAGELAKEVTADTVSVVVNEHWQHGMASSMVCGLKSMMEAKPSLSAVIIMVCDQPFVTASIINNLVTLHQQTGKKIVASEYGDTTGTPALFHKDLFSALLQLKGDTGAKKILLAHPQQLTTLSFPAGSTDIDTQDDVRKLQ